LRRPRRGAERGKENAAAEGEETERALFRASRAQRVIAGAQLAKALNLEEALKVPSGPCHAPCVSRTSCEPSASMTKSSLPFGDCPPRFDGSRGCRGSTSRRPAGDEEVSR